MSKLNLWIFSSTRDSRNKLAPMNYQGEEVEDLIIEPIGSSHVARHVLAPQILVHYSGSDTPAFIYAPNEKAINPLKPGQEMRVYRNGCLLEPKAEHQLFTRKDHLIIVVSDGPITQTTYVIVISIT